MRFTHLERSPLPQRAGRAAGSPCHAARCPQGAIAASGTRDRQTDTMLWGACAVLGSSLPASLLVLHDAVPCSTQGPAARPGRACATACMQHGPQRRCRRPAGLQRVGLGQAHLVHQPASSRLRACRYKTRLLLPIKGPAGAAPATVASGSSEAKRVPVNSVGRVTVTIN